MCGRLHERVCVCLCPFLKLLFESVALLVLQVRFACVWSRVKRGIFEAYFWRGRPWYIFTCDLYDRARLWDVSTSPPSPLLGPLLFFSEWTTHTTSLSYWAPSCQYTDSHLVTLGVKENRRSPPGHDVDNNPRRSSFKRLRRK